MSEWTTYEDFSKLVKYSLKPNRLHPGYYDLYAGQVHIAELAEFPTLGITRIHPLILGFKVNSPECESLKQAQHHAEASFKSWLGSLVFTKHDEEAEGSRECQYER